MPVCRQAGADRQPAAIGHCFNGIGNHAVEHLCKQQLVTHHQRRGPGNKRYLDFRVGYLLLKGTQYRMNRADQVNLFRLAAQRSQTQQQIPHPDRHAVNLTDDIGNIFSGRLPLHTLRKLGAGADACQRITHAMRDCGRHFHQAAIGLVGHQLILLGGQQLRSPPDDPEQSEVNAQPAQRRGHPDQAKAPIDPLDQVHRFFINFHHRQNIALFVNQRNVVLDKELLWRVDKLLFDPPILNFVISRRNAPPGGKSGLQCGIPHDLAPDQDRIG
ncbi:hypothetical protein D3C76_1134670 [compost metagenome]